MAQAQNQSAQNVTGSDKDSGELDYDPYYAQKDKDLSAPAKTGGESGAEAAGEQETGSQPTEEPKIATSAMQSIETKRTTATEVRANWHPAAVRRMRQTLTKSERNNRESGCSRQSGRGACSVCEYRSAGEPAVLWRKQ